MENNQAVAVGAGGCVRAVFSRRVRGFAAPVDLLRVSIRVRRMAAERARVRGAFAGYLVTEPGPGFSARRGVHCLGFDGYAASWDGNLGGVDVRGWGCFSGPIDAPDLIAAGSVLAVGCGWQGGGIPSVIDRGEAFDRGPEISQADFYQLKKVFSDRRWRHEYLPVYCAGDHFRDSDFLPWVLEGDRGALDAAPYIAAGSAVPLCVLRSGVVIANSSAIKREALQ